MNYAQAIDAFKASPSYETAVQLRTVAARERDAGKINSAQYYSVKQLTFAYLYGGPIGKLRDHKLP